MLGYIDIIFVTENFHISPRAVDESFISGHEN